MKNTARNKQIVFFAEMKNSKIKIVFRKSPERPPRELFRYESTFRTQMCLTGGEGVRSSFRESKKKTKLQPRGTWIRQPRHDLKE